MTAAEWLELVAPEVYALADRDTWITMATGALDATGFGNRYTEALALYTAHLATVAGAVAADNGRGASTSGPVTEKKMGAVSVKYASPSSTMSTNDAWLSSTRYGQMYMAIRSTRAAGRAQVITL